MRNITKEIPEQYKGRYFYHFTHLDNIPSIISNGLLSTNLKNKKGITHHNIANEQIQNKRHHMTVDAGPGGVVHDYVPFYFASKNPMLLGLLNRKTIDQQYIVFIAISIEKLLENNVIFTNASANTNVPPIFYDSPTYLDELDWNLIDSYTWQQETAEIRHKKMAEVLIYKKVPIDWIDSYIVFNSKAKSKIQDTYLEMGYNIPKIQYEPAYNRRYFYFTKYFFNTRKNESLVTGPRTLFEYYHNLVQKIISTRKEINLDKNTFDDIEDMLKQIAKNFCCIKELADIYQLKTENNMHYETVSDHTLSVVNNLSDDEEYTMLNTKNKNILKLAAYLHDIGKGPKEKWANGIQKTYPDHPADAIPMLYRILTQEIYQLSNKEIKRICLLVIYHDLLGEIIGKGRSINELKTLELTDREFNMLAILSKADIKSINFSWSWNLNNKINEIRSVL